MKNKNGENYPAYSVSNQLGLVLQSEQFDGSRLDNLDKTSYKIVYPDEFVYNPARINVGSIAFNNLEKIVIVSSLYVVLKISEKIDNKYILQYIKSSEFTKEVKRNTEGSVREYLFFENFCNVRFPYSINIKEQKKIGNLFERLDKLITLHQRKLEQLEQLKNTLLSKMFPKSGTNIPEIRFSGFTDAWKQRKLGEVVNITMGQSPNSENYTENPDDNILVQGNADLKNGRVFPRVWTTQITKTAEKGDLILSVRAPVGSVGKTDYDVVLGRGVAGIKGNEFIFQMLGKMNIDGYWNKYSTGSTFESINSNDIIDAQIILPKEDEQIKLGIFLHQLDEIITIHQRKLEQLKNLKQTLLNKMFI